MRKHQQRQILELIQTLGEAQSIGLVARCRDCAPQIGEFIRRIEGEGGGARTIALLEEYRRLLLKAESGEIGLEPLQDHLIKLESSVRSELKPNRIEIAFLSYNASMADSIESIYLAAKADPDCDAYWIPIPYFERKADGGFGQMRYEGADCYGKDIECTDWREYDVEARHPEVIITFAPYDSGNYVTSVHPVFYCERLRGLTDLLVYCPYFVLAGDVPEHFCTVAGCVFAHKVVLQSEKIRDTYIRVFKARYGDEFGRPEDKFVALGSPKFDKAINARREDFTLPDQWHELIGNRKVILYNTSVGAILQENERYLRKLKFVLDIFRGHDGVTLWWRPHPLNEATYKSMRPQLFEEYEQIVANYRREGFGIYDDTPDLHRAIAWSDAYYGDGSSLIEFFKISKKDILIQNPQYAVDSAGYNRVRFLDFFEDHEDNCLWFSALDANGLFKYRRRPGQQLNCVSRFNFGQAKTELVANFSTNTLYERYRAICRRRERLYLAPVFADNIAVYDITENKLSAVPLKPMNAFHSMPTDGAAKFIAAHNWGKYIFFTPIGYGAIVRYDTETGEAEYYCDYIPELEALAFSKDRPWFSHSVADGDCIYLPSSCANAIVEFDMRTCKSSVCSLGDGKTSYRTICKCGTSFWIMHYSGDAVSEYAKVKGIVKTIKFEHKSLYSYVYCINGQILRIPCAGDMTFDVIAPQNNYSESSVKFEIPWSANADLSDIYPDNDSVLSCKMCGDKMFVYSAVSDSVCVFDFDGNLVSEFNTDLKQNDVMKLNESHSFVLTNIANENGGYIYKLEDFYGLKLPFYLKYVSEKKVEATKRFSISSCGGAIYDFVKGACI
jgi:hypothetical protein